MRFGGFGFSKQFGFSTAVVPPSAGFDPAFNYIGNGTFTNADGWTLSIWAIGSGIMTGAASGHARCTAAATLAAGTYHFECDDLVQVADEDFDVTVAGTAQTAISDGTKYTCDIVVASVSDQLIQFTSASSESAELDNAILTRTA